jgi:hypothetical protein
VTAGVDVPSPCPSVVPAALASPLDASAYARAPSPEVPSPDVPSPVAGDGLALLPERVELAFVEDCPSSPAARADFSEGLVPS